MLHFHFHIGVWQPLGLTQFCRHFKHWSVKLEPVMRHPTVVTIALNKEDEKRTRQIMNYPWFKEKRWQKELQKIMDSRVMLELEALFARGISFISETYLPEKIQNDDYLE